MPSAAEPVAADLERREPRCRVCRDPDIRSLVDDRLDWRGVPIILGRGKIHRITYDSLWIHVASQSVACIRWNRWNVQPIIH